MTFDNIKRSF